ncbi:MAG TPA: nitroreductase family deazaflavin-dependent oxidoreductase [Thermomicrobiaceae bacterium]|nr:nitroreductase family deazaflavin-dependent oxidoreductase [Thermomicrobiaceae bacterium]
MNDYDRNLINEFRANRGKATSDVANQRVVLLTTVGKKSGQPRTTPLVYTTDGDRLVVIASKGGAPTNPDWYYNLLANPTVTVELRDETFQARARVVEGADRERLYDAHAAVLPVFDDYRRKTTRQIPVIVLERLA